jgi:hypothetical protein
MRHIGGQNWAFGFKNVTKQSGLSQSQLLLNK